MSRKILLRISIIILFHIQLIKNKYKRLSNSFYNSAYYYKYNTAIGGPGHIRYPPPIMFYSIFCSHSVHTSILY